MSMEYQDCFTGEYSNCCDAQIYVTEICSACKEHCEPLKENQEQESIEIPISEDDFQHQLHDLVYGDGEKNCFMWNFRTKETDRLINVKFVNEEKSNE